LVEDPEGSDLPDERSAHDEAVRSVRDILATTLLAGREPVGTALIIADEQGRKLDTVRFVDVLPATLKRDLSHA
jgi:hypothetical protein